MEKFDVVVIGAGPGGYPAAIRAAQLGAKTAIVEKEKLGGTCLNWGCIPTKALIAGAELFGRMKHCGQFGIAAPSVSADYAKMAARKTEVVDGLRAGVGQLLKAHGVTLIEGAASFRSRNVIDVAAAGGAQSIAAGRTIIATGSESAMPGFVPRHERVLESRGFLDLTKLPSSLLVLGGGIIGCELACMAALLGGQVTVVELLEDIMIVLDADARREVRRHMEQALGIKVLTGAPLERIEAGPRGVKGTVKDQEVSADMLLVAVGRVPVTRGLRADAVGVGLSEKGFIRIDEHCRTTLASVYAIGDVTDGSVQLAHSATSQGVIAAENACGAKRRVKDALVPSCIFTSPEVGSVGLTEAAAKQQGRQVHVGRFAFAGLGKARAAGETGGFVKWIADASTDQLLGACAVGAHATELVSEATVAIRAQLTAEELGRTIHCHPTFSEAWMEAAHAVHGACIHAPPKRKPAG